VDQIPFVSICLLTYKRASVLARSLDSLLAQTQCDFELIINDDCSPDDTESLCRSYERSDARVRYCKNERNLRYAGNQNAALARARSDYVAIVHDGDVYRPDLIEKWATALVRHPSAAFAFNALEAMDLSGQTVAVFREDLPELVPGRTLFDRMIVSDSSPIFGIVMVRKSCVESVGPFDESLPVLADVDMWLRLLLRYDAAYIDEPLLKVAARENDHANREINWKIQAEFERIYLLNLDRRYSDESIDKARTRAVIYRFIQRRRRRALLWCAYRGRVALFAEGFRYIRKHPIQG
jgi:glycosyltransferase involved in cell wall biosynthesis